MFKIALNKLYLTKGDTARFKINVKTRSDIPYDLADEDKIYFIVTNTPEIVSVDDIANSLSEVLEFYKEGPNILINPEDTMDLKKDSYYYQVRLKLEESGDVITLVEPTWFILTPSSNDVP